MAFGRVVEVTAGPKGGKGNTIRDLKIEFTVEKTDSAAPNKATVKIRNLSKQTSDTISAKGNHLTLRAGYEDETVASIFFGDILRGVSYLDGTDRVTELEAYDGQSATGTPQVSLSFAKDTKVSSVVSQILSALSLPSKGMNKVPSSATYPAGYAFVGMAKDALKEVLVRVGLVFTIQNEMIYIMEPGGTADNSGLSLSTTSGLLTVPTPLSDKTGMDDKTPVPTKWKLITLLYPELSPGATFNIKSASVNGLLRIEKTTFSGDNWMDKFQADIEARVV